MRHEGEPSVEEILESIKKVIARDNRGVQQVERHRRENAGVMLTPGKPTDTDGEELEDEDEVLELGEAGELVEIEPEFDEPVVPGFDWQVGADEPFEVEAEIPSNQGPATDETGLTTESAARSMRDSLAALTMVAALDPSSQAARSSDSSIEGMVREMLRPMLAEWLDRNLPEMVERLVKAEIARITGTGH